MLEPLVPITVASSGDTFNTFLWGSDSLWHGIFIRVKLRLGLDSQNKPCWDESSQKYA
jgi:hypothetical protein